MGNFPLAKKGFIMTTRRNTKKTGVKVATKRAPKKVTAKTKKATDVPVGYKTNYDGFNSKIFLQSVKNKTDLPRGVHSTFSSAKKDIVARIKADAKKAIDRVNGLKVAKSKPGTKKKTAKVSAAPKKVTKKTRAVSKKK